MPRARELGIIQGERVVQADGVTREYAEYVAANWHQYGAEVEPTKHDAATVAKWDADENAADARAREFGERL